jgi:protoporphyrinogen oxidase
MNIAIIGAGAGGLSAAYDLARAGHHVVQYEAGDQVGGLAAGFKAPGWDWSLERYYHHWFASDHAILGLIAELGWSDRLLFPWPITAAFHQERFYPLDGPLSSLFGGAAWMDRLPGAGMLERALHIFRYPALNWPDRLRYGLAGLYLTLTPSWERFEQTTAHTWLQRWMGKHVYQVLWEPLLVSKFGEHYQQVNMAWFWARVKARTPRLGTFRGGFQAFLEALAERVRSLGVDLQLQTPVEHIEAQSGGGLRVRIRGEERSFDRCLVTTSPGLLARLAPSMPQDYLNRLLSLRSMGAVNVILALRHQLSERGFYWHNLVKSAGFPFLALVEHTNFVSPEFFGGDHIVYCGDYLEPEHEYFSLSKDDLVQRFLPSLSRVNPRFSPDWVRESWLFRTPYAQPIPLLNHSQAIPDLRTPLPGLWFASMSQVYPWDRGTNYAVEIARRAVRRMLDERAAG